MVLVFLMFFSSTAGLRRSFRLSRKEKENNLNDTKQADQADATEFLTYEEVTKYQQQPGDQRRLVVLIGKIQNWFKFLIYLLLPIFMPTPRDFNFFIYFFKIPIFGQYLLSSLKWQSFKTQKQTKQTKTPHQILQEIRTQDCVICLIHFQCWGMLLTQTCKLMLSEQWWKVGCWTELSIKILRVILIQCA